MNGASSSRCSAVRSPCHDEWHQGFYSKLNRNDGKGSCCNLMDCRPTQSRVVGDHYEVKASEAD